MRWIFWSRVRLESSGVSHIRPVPRRSQPTLPRASTPSMQVVELLMLRSGCDVCCTSDSDRTAIQRFEARLAAERAAKQ